MEKEEEDNGHMAEDKSIRCAAIEFAFRVLSGMAFRDQDRVPLLLKAASEIETFINTGSVPEKVHDNGGELQ